MWLRQHLEMLTNANETKREKPWKVNDAPPSFIRSLSRGIVGLQMVVDRLEGCWKINQDKSEPDLMGTKKGLEASGDNGVNLAKELQNRI